MLKGINPRLLESEKIQRCCLDDCKAACCLHGVWLDRLEMQRIMEQAGKIAPHMSHQRRDARNWFGRKWEADSHSLSGEVIHSAIVRSRAHYGGTACIFLRRDSKCALQVAADFEGLHSWTFKPFYCILHPLDLDEKGRITLDRAQELLAEPASCLRPAPRLNSLLVVFQAELSYFLGGEEYDRLLAAHPGIEGGASNG